MEPVKMSTLLLCLLISSLLSNAQTITGMVKDDGGNLLTGATVAIKKVKDSTLVKLGVTNASGRYQFNKIPAGSYFINYSFIGHITANSVNIEVEDGAVIQVPETRLIKSEGNLAKVSVTGTRPLVEVTMDKTVLNVEGTVNSVGQDGLELLRKAPGVDVSQNDNISLNGKSGVQIYIDGRRTPLSGSDLAAYLRSLPSNSIDAIEIISNPSAKYEAAGNAGIINIRLKKDKSLGTNGSLSGGYNIGIYSKYNGGLSLNHRNKYLNIFGNFTYNKGIRWWELDIDRDVSDTLFHQKSTVFTHYNTQIFKAGIDYFINKKSIIGVMVNGNISPATYSGSSKALISYLPTNQPVKLLVADNTEKSRRINQNLNLNYRYADARRREWNMDADHGSFRIRRDQLQPNIYYNPEGTTVIDSRIYNILTPADIDINTFKSDYEQDFKKGRLGFGGKLASIKTQNDLEQFFVQQSVKTPDTSHTNAFVYKENINALYVNYNRAFKKLKVQLGLRIENTNIRGYTGGFQWKDNGYHSYDSTFTRHYTDPFPNIGLSFSTNASNQWQVIYGRRIDRPNYEDMNPFETRLDEYTFKRGNTDLRPQYTTNLSVTHSYKSKLITKLSYSYINDGFGGVLDTLDKSKTFLSFKNLATQQIVNANSTYTVQYKWYSLFTNLNGSFIRLKADFGEGRKVDFSIFTWSVSQQHTFKFGKGWTGEIFARYSSPGLLGITRSRAVYSADGGLQKKFLNGKLNIKASVSDMFKTMLYRNSTNFAGQHSKGTARQEFRQFKLGVTYNFGSSQVKAVRQRSTGLEEESRRVGN
jgi:hypothetical protein